ncbi:hypothetical protein Goshw_005947 [Gossypium schwendimanii]|uniref:Uncharacterized protein n=1 Tax=Gossypium schwendimanii TaxID=34291 RepID=A0A7J9MME8_GOSSC|nr:hypothetical protein [Gossypium schwendimanii]
MEDSMAEDTVQASPAVVTFSQQPISPPASGFVFAIRMSLMPAQMRGAVKNVAVISSFLWAGWSQFCMFFLVKIRDNIWNCTISIS